MAVHGALWGSGRTVQGKETGSDGLVLAAFVVALRYASHKGSCPKRITSLSSCKEGWITAPSSPSSFPLRAGNTAKHSPIY